MASFETNEKLPDTPAFMVSARFLDELPTIYKKKEQAMIDHLRKTIASDEEIHDKFE